MNQEAENILARVYHLYKKYGIKSITMDDVARELGISKKTLYQHFADKTELVIKAFDYEHEIKASYFRRIYSESFNAIEQLFEVGKFVNEMLKEYNPTIDYDLKKYYPEIHLSRQKVMVEKMTESLLCNINKGINEGLYRKDVNPIVIARLHVSRIVSMFDNQVFTIEEFTSLHIQKEVMVYHIRGLASEKGIRFLEEALKKYDN